MIKKTICFSNPTKLSLRTGQMVISTGETTITRPIEDLGVVVLETGMVTLSSALLSALLDANVAVITCDARHMPNGMLCPLAGNTLQQERSEAQISASLPLKKMLWQQTIAAKIRNQAALLNARGVETGNMNAWAQSVRSGDPENLEARAAAYYWSQLLPQFEDFTRGRFDDSPNELFNYGYAVLRAVIARSLVGSGLLPTLGIHHCNRYNAYCLADDIMEPYRPYVDLLVCQILDEGNYEGVITTDVKKQLLSIPVIDVKIGKLSRPLMIAASLTTASLAKCFLGETKKLNYPDLK